MSNTKNYFAHGGNELVIGGKLTFLPGAVVEGCESLFGAVPEDNAHILAVEDSEATTVSALREDFNHLLNALREAGLISTNSMATERNIALSEEPGDGP